VRRRHSSKNFADGAFNHLDDRVIRIANSTSKTFHTFAADKVAKLTDLTMAGEKS
jgi:hypothetical protein